MEHKKKKLLVICIAIIYIQFIAVGTISAYFTDNETKNNIINMGNVTVEIVEDIIGGEKENVGIRNTGNNPCYIRLYVGIPTGIDGSDIYTTNPSLYTIVNGVKQEVARIITTTDEAGNITDKYEWIKSGDYWYYAGNLVEGKEDAGILGVGKNAILFQNISFVDNLDNFPDGDNSNIIIYVEAVQSEHVIDGDKPDEMSAAEYAFLQLKQN